MSKNFWNQKELKKVKNGPKILKDIFSWSIQFNSYYHMQGLAKITIKKKKNPQIVMVEKNQPFQ